MSQHARATAVKAARSLHRKPCQPSDICLINIRFADIRLGAWGVGLVLAWVWSLLSADGARAAEQAEPAKTPQQQQDEKVYGRLASAWSSFYAGDYEKAATQAAALLEATDARYRRAAVEAGHIQARCLWAFGSRASEAKAKALWKKLGELSDDPATGARLKIADALELSATESDARLERAAKILGEVL